MKLAVTANGTDLDAQASPIFGRCPTYIFVDTETMAFEAVENPAIGAPGGAGIQAAQFVVERGAQAVVSGNIGPNAFGVLPSAKLPVYVFRGGTVREAVEAYKSGELTVSGGASAKAHAGMGMASGIGRGRGMGRGMGTGRAAVVPPTPSPAASAGSREEEIAAIKDRAGDLRRQLAKVMERLDQLEIGE